MSQTQLIPFSEVQQQAATIAKSRLYGFDTPEQVLTLMLVAQSEGRHPASAAKDYHLIKGKPSLKADAMLARFQQAGGSVRWNERTNDKVSATFAHAQGGEVTITWTIEDAKRAGLANNDNYRKFPRQMLSARCISEGVRSVYPSVISGFYTPEEVQDFSVSAPAEKPAIAKPVFKIEQVTEAEIVDENEPNNQLSTLEEINLLLHREGLTDVEVFAFLDHKKVKHDATTLQELRPAVLSRVLEKFDDIVAFTFKK